ncbi:helix-turn-helix domain-containing protein [Eubacteriales bacterium DFI.9.88]|nr:helix-turn-helix domain-containing protein [Eubacteriales bacterium DFI.9.88]
MLFSRMLRTIRLERELSQRELAKLSGISPNAISYYEKDKRIPSIDAVQKLAAALNVNASIFLNPKEYEEFLSDSALYQPIKDFSSYEAKINLYGPPHTGAQEEQRKKRLLNSFYKMSPSGQKTLCERAEELLEITKNKKSID